MFLYLAAIAGEKVDPKKFSLETTILFAHLPWTHASMNRGPWHVLQGPLSTTEGNEIKCCTLEILLSTILDKSSSEVKCIDFLINS